MHAQKADAAPELRHDLAESLSQGRAWLTGLIDADGQIAGSDLALLYYKVPAALALNGELGAALRSLEWIARRLIGSDGALVVPEGQAPARAYDRGWLIWGAATCGRYDIAFRLAEELRAQQNGATGGFWDTPEALETRRGRHHAMTAGMAGLGLLSVRYVDEAQRAADFLVQLLQRQPKPEEGFHLAVHASDKGEQTLSADPAPSDYVDRRATRQRPARIGPVQILLIRLYRLLGTREYLEAAQAYTNVFLDGPEGIYDCVEAHKFLWALAELDEIAPDTRHRPAAERIVDYIVSRQQPSGEWWGDAVGGGREGQSLDLRLNTTANVLVGLACYRHLTL